MLSLPRLQFLREMAQPSEASQVSLALDQLQQHSCYVSRVANTGIAQHPMQEVADVPWASGDLATTGSKVAPTPMDTSQ